MRRSAGRTMAPPVYKGGFDARVLFKAFMALHDFDF